ncbi:MAG TPA: TlpA disulfide reductase family protein [Myxococcota bacterium]|nr:TlpA disulfide reductase family protein [Myxococcota bacterium]HRY92499.1 TlpA disulfide reductase family protein [Myxococcota bacterium]HSA24143.1 TlpA disulfide reductase family protein [Myxococcota bacterium]
MRDTRLAHGAGRGWWLGLGLLACLAGAAWAEEVAGLKPGSAAPVFFMDTYNPEASGVKRVFLDKLVGPTAENPRKLVLLSFFNIDCKPCRQELPFLQRLHARYAAAGLGVVVVNCDSKPEKIEELLAYLKASAFTFPVLKDRFQALQRRYAVASFPTMYFLDGQGLVQEARVGYNEEKNPFPLASLQQRLGVPVEALPANP